MLGPALFSGAADRAHGRYNAGRTRDMEAGTMSIRRNHLPGPTLALLVLLFPLGETHGLLFGGNGLFFLAIHELSAGKSIQK